MRLDAIGKRMKAGEMNMRKATGTVENKDGNSREFSLKLHVPYAHIDKMGVVYYANYFVYFEMARASMMREVGLPYGELEDRGIMLPVIETRCRYRQPARFDDELTVIIHNMAFQGPVLHIEYRVTRGDDLLATGFTDHVCMSPKGRVLKPADDLKRLLLGDASSEAP